VHGKNSYFRQQRQNLDALKLLSNYGVVLKAHVDGQGAGRVVKGMRKNKKSEAQFVALIIG
jgi:hypothetical protein